MDGASPITSLVKFLCWWQVACTALLLATTAVFFGFDVPVDSRNPAADLWAFSVFWAWLAGTPLVGATALLLNRKVGWRPARPMNIGVLVLWTAGVVATFFLHLG